VETIEECSRWLLDEEPPGGLRELTSGDLERYLGA
jgi:hypothetical protein